MFKLKEQTHDDDDLTQRDKMSSESLTGAKSSDLQCHWFPVGGSLMRCTSVGDRDTVWRGHYESRQSLSDFAA